VISDLQQLTGAAKMRAIGTAFAFLLLKIK